MPIPHHPSTHAARVPMPQDAGTHRLDFVSRQWLDLRTTLPMAGLQLADLAVYLSILFVVSLIVGKLKSVMQSHETLKAG